MSKLWLALAAAALSGNAWADAIGAFCGQSGKFRAAEEFFPIIALQYVDGQNQIAAAYPLNPNGSPQGIAGVSSADGRVTIMMPHPERVYRSAQMSWAPEGWGELSGWYRLFAGARKALG